MARLVLTLFGAGRVELDGIPLHLGREKAFALLAYLVVTGRSHRRDELAALLWPDADQPHARGSLRRCLSLLVAQLPPGTLHTSHSAIGLESAGVISADVVAFRELLSACDEEMRLGRGVDGRCLKRLDQAAELYEGDFLSGFSLADCPDFEEWQRYESESLRRDLFLVFDRLSAHLLACGDFSRSIHYLRRWLQLDPLAETAQHRLMQAYAQSGHPSGALRQYEQYADLLEIETGSEPGRSMTSLYVAVKKGEYAPSAPADEGMETPETVESDLGQRLPAFLSHTVADTKAPVPFCVAREGRLSQMYSCLAGALAGHGHVVFVTGEAGTGKTTLIGEFLRRALDDEAELIAAYGGCDAYAGIGDAYQPFRALTAMLTGAVEEPWASGLITQDQARRLWALAREAAEDLVYHHRGLIGSFVDSRALAERIGIWRRRAEADSRVGLPLSAIDVVSNQAHLFEQYFDWLRRIADRHPLLLVLEDLHWADTSSIGLLFFLGRQIRHQRILIVCSYRPEEIELASSDRALLLDEVRDELRLLYGEVEIGLDRYAEEEGLRFVEAVLDATPNRLGEAFRRQLYAQSRGHPLFTVELLRELRERGQLVVDTQGYLIEGQDIVWDTLPTRVEGVIAKRLGRLDSELLDTLAAASVEGEQFTAEVVAAVRSLDMRELVPKLSGDLAKRHRLIQATSTQRLNGQRLSHYRFSHNLFQQYLYRSLDTVERAYLHERVAVALEDLFTSRPGELAVRAGQLARHFEAAQMPDRAVKYWEQAGKAAVRVSANDEAVANFRRALELLQTMPAGQARAERELELRLSLGVPLAAVRGYSHREVARLYASARRLCSHTGRTEKQFPALYGLWRYHLVRAHMRPATNMAEELLRLAKLSDDRELLLEAERAVGVAGFHRGTQVEARTHLERGLALYNRESDRTHFHLFGHDPAVSCYSYLALSLWLLGFPQQALATSSKGVELSTRLEHSFSLIHSYLNGAAEVLTMRREHEAARESAQRALTLANKHRYPQWQGFAQILLGSAMSALAQTTAGIAMMEEGLKTLDSINMKAHRVFFLACLAEGYARAGQIAPMKEVLSLALSVATAGGEHAWLAEVHRLQGEAARMEGADSAISETHLRNALAVARRQQVRSLELRAVVSLCRLLHTLGRGDECRPDLAQIYAGFDEGHDTVDLREAREFLAKL